MRTKIIGTLVSKLSVALINLMLVIVSAKFLGAEIRGNMSLILLGITLISLINDIVGGPVLVYLVPRVSLSKILISSYLWAILVVSSGSFLFAYFKIIPPQFGVELFFVSLLQCLNTIHLDVLLGKEKIRNYNFIFFVQTTILFISFCVLLFLWNKREIIIYIYSLYISYFIALCISSYFVFRVSRTINNKENVSVVKIFFRDGMLNQLANIARILSTRISYYFIELFVGTVAVGIYSTGVSITEGLLLLSSSVSLVIYSKISNTDDKEYSQRLTIKLSKFCLIISVTTMIILTLLPAQFYAFIFGAEFLDVKKVIISLGAGILALSFSMVYSHYFSGIGKYYINTISSSIALIVSVSLGIIVIPHYHLVGAGLVTSFAYLMSATFLFYKFIKETKLSYKELLPSFRDVFVIKNEIKKLKSQISNKS